ncbi:hypothetical protein [Limnoglobus roseus]|uniref:Uncharacterized protein n=1 Tax=Limnoglobus roseus TaxID=2598579 RepID=A0A5C1ALJ2_9BACT|nr:hypothetical protein [Limnoglobus roseus]QEL19820.1 hypothetical protein PX52LOC_06901 [Limnoglobus roseus]
MYRSLLVLLVAAPLAAAPVPKAAPDYYPVGKGDRWEYLINGKPYVLTVAAVEEGTDGRLATIVHEGTTKNTVVRKDRVTAAGVFTVENYGAAVATPHQLLKFPLTAKATWKYEVPGGDGNPVEAFTYTAGGVEDVEVPAGTFRAVRVEASSSLGAGGVHQLVRPRGRPRPEQDGEQLMGVEGVHRGEVTAEMSDYFELIQGAKFKPSATIAISFQALKRPFAGRWTYRRVPTTVTVSPLSLMHVGT